MKPWGSTRELVKSFHFSLHDVKIVAGGYSSIHYHRLKYNYIYVVKGSLDVETYYFDKHRNPPVGLDMITKAIPGSLLALPPFKIHKFIALTDVQMFEWYTSPLFVFRNDIVRYTENGVRAVGP